MWRATGKFLLNVMTTYTTWIIGWHGSSFERFVSVEFIKGNITPVSVKQRHFEPARLHSAIEIQSSITFLEMLIWMSTLAMVSLMILSRCSADPTPVWAAVLVPCVFWTHAWFSDGIYIRLNRENPQFFLFLMMSIFSLMAFSLGLMAFWSDAIRSVFTPNGYFKMAEVSGFAFSLLIPILKWKFRQDWNSYDKIYHEDWFPMFEQAQIERMRKQHQSPQVGVTFSRRRL